MKKFFAFCMLFIFVLQIGIVFAVDDFRETALYYGDVDNNGKIDTLEIHFSDTIQGSINLDKLILYSNTGGLSSQKLDDVRGESIFSTSTLSGNILTLTLLEQDLYQTGLIIDNTTSSHLRLKTNAGVGITDLNGKEIKLLYGSSFLSYSQVFYKDFSQDTSPENPPEVPELPVIPDIPDEPGEGDGSGEIIPPDNSGSGEIGSGVIIPPVLPEDPVFSGGIDVGTGSTFTGELFWNTQKIFQSPSYILEKDIEKDLYLCDTTQQECRVNFQILVSESGSEFKTPLSSKYVCEWNFGDPQFEEEKNKCNPNTITFPVGEFQVSYTVFEKNDLSKKINKTFSIKNTGYVPPRQKVVYIGGGGGSSSHSDIHIQNPVIELQSGLDENNFCVKNDCGVNFIYEPKHEKERCLWDFSGGNYSNGTLTRCNPGVVSYPLGSFEVKLKVYELGKEGNYKTASYLFVNKKIEKPLLNSQSGAFIIPDEKEYQAKITLQGTQNKTKYMEGKNIFCLSEFCNLNFDGRDSVIPQGEKIKYVWDFGNGKSFSGANPGGIDFGVGKYEVIFSLFSSSGEKYSENIFVNVGIPEEKTLTLEEKGQIQEKYPIVISGVFPNPKGKDTQEFIEFSYSGGQQMSLSNCEVRYGDAKKQKTFLFPEYFFFSSGENKKLYQFDSQITLKNSGENILALFCEGQKIDELMWNFQVPEEFILQKSFFPQDILQIKKNHKSKQFQIIYKNGDEKIVNFHLENTVYDDFLKEINSENFAGNQEEKQQRIQNFINQTFYQKISKQKKGVKIYGNTFPNTAVVIELEKTNDDFSFFPQAHASHIFETFSDNFGSYEAFISVPPKGEFEVKTYLKSGENAIFPIEQSSTLEIDDDYLAYIGEKTQENFVEKPLLSVIEVQGKNTKTKTISLQKVVCRDVETCSVNFDGRKSQGNNLEYLWDYGDGKTYDKSNPGAYNFGPGKHVISLKVSDGNKSHTSYFLVEVTPKPPKVQKIIKAQKELDTISEKSSFQQQQTFDSLPMKYHFFYSGLIFLLFLILSGLVLRQKNII